MTGDRGATREEADLPWPSLDIVFDAIKGSLEEQNGLVDSLDGKAVFTLGAASVLTGGVGTLTTGLAAFGGDETKSMKHLDLGLLNASATQLAVAVVAVIFAAYLYVVYATYQAYRLRRFAVVPDPVVLATDYINRPARHTKATMTSAMANAFAQNLDSIAAKTRWTNRALKGIAMQAALTLVVGALQLWMV